MAGPLGKSPGGGLDELVAVSAADTTPGYLASKVLAGAGLTGTIITPAGDEDLQLDVVANADGSIVVNADDILVGVLATDAQHGTRGGGTQHAAATGSVSGFLSAADKTILDGHVSDGTIHFTVGSIDHGSLDGASLADDDHAGYLWGLGRAGGQTLTGGTLTTQDLTLRDNAVDANQLPWGQGLNAGLLDGQTGGHDSQWRHIGVGAFAAGNGHMILCQENFTGSGNKVGMGMFPAFTGIASTGNLYGVQGNVFFGGSAWAAGSNINALQFYPAPDYQYGSTTWGNANLNMLGITTGGMINIFGRTVTCNDLIGITTQSLAHIFGAPGAVSATRALGLWVSTPSVSTGTIARQTGIEISPQGSAATVNQGAWFKGDSAGSDICLGAGSGNNPDARVYFNGTNLIVDPDNIGSGIVLIGATGDDNMRLTDIEIDGALNHDGAGVGFYGTAPIAKQTGVAVTAAAIHAALVALGLITA